MCGNTTMSRSGSTGKAWLAPGVRGGRGFGAFIRPNLSAVPEEFYSPKGNGALQVDLLENPAGFVCRPIRWRCTMGVSRSGKTLVPNYLRSLRPPGLSPAISNRVAYYK